jgi:hypothetical protein
MTVTRFENGHSGGAAETLDAIQKALEAAGIQFIPENGGGAGVRMKFNRREVKAIDRLEDEGGPAREDDL